MTRTRHHPASPLKHLTVRATVPQSDDLKIKAQAAVAIERVIGELASGLLAHGEPLTLGASVEERIDLSTKIATPGAEPIRVVDITLWWEKTQHNGMHIFKDVLLPVRCLECADLMMRGEHVCSPVDPAPSPDHIPGGEASPETLQ